MSFDFGFGSKRFMQDDILYFIESIQDEIENGNIVHAVLLDLSKAFNSLSHQILLKKHQSLHFSTSAIKTVEKILTNRSIETFFCKCCCILID